METQQYIMILKHEEISLTYRGNLARLIEVLIQEGELEKAEEIADLAMEKMPVDLFGFYTLARALYWCLL